MIERSNFKQFIDNNLSEIINIFQKHTIIKLYYSDKHHGDGYVNFYFNDSSYLKTTIYNDNIVTGMLSAENESIVFKQIKRKYNVWDIMN